MSILQRISSISHNCSSASDSSQWYTTTLGFEELERTSFGGSWLAELLQLPKATIERRRLCLGQEILELWQFEPSSAAEASQGNGGQALCPAGNDGAFQHICIVTRDLHQAYAHGADRAKQISSAPQRLPDWNPGAGGIWAVKFQDPDGHPLELLQFPSGKGDQRWQQSPRITAIPGETKEETSRDLFLGLDHTAISVANTERSLRFYRDSLGMTLAAQGHNHGPEQDRMDGLVGTDVLISSLHPAGAGMGIELLNYRKPEGGRRPRANPQASDAVEWRISAVVDDLVGLHKRLQDSPLNEQVGPLVELPPGFGPGHLAFQVRDPDGHALLLY
jgi:catechol 2,3-dioxygenase-like lactoylglutathione lyase family enzyme